MEKVESFKLDHNKVKAPYVRKCCVLDGKIGDKVSKFDLRFLQPNVEAFGTASMHGLEHLLATYLREELDNKIKEYGIEDTFILLGKKENPYPYIKAADYFMLTSYYEGYPMVLLEAKALNKYIIITDSAARETILDYENKIIVKNNEDGIYKGIKAILKNKPKAKNKNKDANKKILDEIVNVIEGE